MMMMMMMTQQKTEHNTKNNILNVLSLFGLFCFSLFIPRGIPPPPPPYPIPPPLPESLIWVRVLISFCFVCCYCCSCGCCCLCILFCGPFSNLFWWMFSCVSLLLFLLKWSQFWLHLSHVVKHKVVFVGCFLARPLLAMGQSLTHSLTQPVGRQWGVDLWEV